MVKPNITDRLSLIRHTVTLLICMFFINLMHPVGSPINNALLVISRESIVGLLAVAISFVHIAGDVDLSVGGLVVLSGNLIGLILTNGEIPLALAVALTVLCGIACGAVNGILVGYLRFTPWLATLCTMFAYDSVGIALSQGIVYSRFPDSFKFIGQGTLWIIPVPMLTLLFLVVISYCFLTFTASGRRFYAVGDNRVSAFWSGVDIRRIRLAAYVVCGAISSLAGIVYVARVNSSFVPAIYYSTGNSTQLAAEAIIIALLSGIDFVGGKGSVLRVFYGIIIWSFIRSALVYFNINDYYAFILKGLLLLYALWRSSRRERMSGIQD